MRNEIISYMEMCMREGQSLQRGMNYSVGGTHSVLLMSLRPGSPYDDALTDGGSTLLYEGHDVPRSLRFAQPKLLDQPEYLPSGKLSENGKFHKAAQEFKAGKRGPERVRVYEKIKAGIWSYNGIFHLVDSWKEDAGKRRVFKFKLIAVEGEEDFSKPASSAPVRGRLIPSSVKLQVWIRDGGKCTVCESDEDLHFDHIIPYSKGGSSAMAENVQILCAKHNLEKSDNIQ
ncbi:MAG TPA: HNH endonuclease [Blastocatellia bacterium]|nr:HNH endonuclease [Blastocatellia bacterium]